MPGDWAAAGGVSGMGELGRVTAPLGSWLRAAWLNGG